MRSRPGSRRLLLPLALVGGAVLGVVALQRVRAQRDVLRTDRARRTPQNSKRSMIAFVGPRGSLEQGYHTKPSFCAIPIRCNLPVAPFGISARITILRGTLKSASLIAAKARIS